MSNTIIFSDAIATVKAFAAKVADYDRRGDKTMRDQTLRNAQEYIDTRVPRNGRKFARQILAG